MNPENSVHPLSHPLLAVGLSAPVLRVVSSYMNLWPKLIYADAWYSIAMDPGKRIGSQQWHRDPEDKQMVKVYLYFSEVDESAGAMEYILGTSNAIGGQGKKIGEWKAAGANLYPSAELVEQSFPAHGTSTALARLARSCFVIQRDFIAAASRGHGHALLQHGHLLHRPPGTNGDSRFVQWTAWCSAKKLGSRWIWTARAR